MLTYEYFFCTILLQKDVIADIVSPYFTSRTENWRCGTVIVHGHPAIQRCGR